MFDNNESTSDIFNAQGQMTREAPHSGTGHRGKEQSAPEVTLGK